MRIISGRLHGGQFALPKGSRARPMTSLLLASLMSRLFQPDTELSAQLAGGCFLDLCAGSGLIGFEAYSRGAARTVFVESDSAACDAIRRDVLRFGIERDAQVLRIDARRCHKGVLKALGGLPLAAIMLDPPFIPGMAADVLREFTDALGRSELLERLAPAALLAVRGIDELPERSGPLRLLEQRRAGRAKFWLYAR